MLPKRNTIATSVECCYRDLSPTSFPPDPVVLEKFAGCVDSRSRAAAAGTIWEKSEFSLVPAGQTEQQHTEVIGSMKSTTQVE